MKLKEQKYKTNKWMQDWKDERIVGWNWKNMKWVNECYVKKYEMNKWMLREKVWNE